MKRVINYVKDTKGELKHVSWPTRKQALVFTAIVVAISLVVSAYLGALDFVFTKIIELFVI